jgi:hypothetical protein
MQLPLEWYVYIIPGSLFLLSTILLLSKKDLEIIKEFIKKYNALLILPVLIIFSFLIGFAADRFIHVLYDIKQSICNSEQTIISGEALYTRMAFTRLLALSFTILIFISVFRIYKRTTFLEKYGRKIVLIIILLVATCIWIQYFVNKSEYVKNHIPKNNQSIDSLQNGAIKNDSVNMHHLPLIK